MEDLWDKIWKAKNGRVVIWQTPNVWLIGWVGLTLISLFFNGKTADVLAWVASALLIIWSALEILKGANYFRRALGVLVLIFSIMFLMKSL